MFENTTLYDKAAVWAMTRVFTRRFQRKSYLLRKCFYLGAGLLGTVGGLILLPAFGALDHGERLICVMALAVCVPALLKGLFLRRFIAWSTGRVLRKAVSPRERRFVFSEESFLCVEPGIETAYQYETVQGACETEKYFILRLNRQTCVILDKAGFTRGTAGGFRSFLERKLEKPVESVK